MSATCSIQPFGGKRYEKPDNVTASMYVAMEDVPAVKQLPVVALVQSQIVTGNTPSCCCTTVKGYLLLYCVATCSGHYNGIAVHCSTSRYRRGTMVHCGPS